MCDQISLAVFQFLSAPDPLLLQVGPTGLAVTCGVVGYSPHSESRLSLPLLSGLLKAVMGISGRALCSPLGEK